MQLGGIDYRRAQDTDAFAIMRIHQLSSDDVFKDPLLLDYRRLLLEIESPNSVWVVGEREGRVLAALSILLDREHGIAKIGRFIVDPAWHDGEAILRGAWQLLAHYLSEKGIEVIYTTTRTLSLSQQQMTLELGYKILGIFPNASGADPWKVNGLSGFFFDGVLGHRRDVDFKLHPNVVPIFEITRKQCGLDPIPTAPLPVVDASLFEKLPQLELFHAPAYVSQRYAGLREKGSLSVNFYPFHEPNALVTDPKQRIEIFVRMMPENRFAAIIGERLDMGVSPTELYDAVSLMLNQRGISFIEVINDAADPLGIDFICNAGYIPCAYFPSFKRQGDERRDFVVMARTFERLVGTTVGHRLVNPVYLEYLAAYYRLDEQLHLERLKR